MEDELMVRRARKAIRTLLSSSLSPYESEDATVENVANDPAHWEFPLSDLALLNLARSK